MSILSKMLAGQAENPSSGRLYGLYRGQCLYDKDPMKLGRIKAYIPIVHGGVIPDPTTIVWTNPCLPFGGGPQIGCILVPEPSTSLWVMFENGDTQKPVYVGSWWGSPNGTNEIPDDVYAPDEEEKKSALGKYVFLMGDAMIYYDAKNCWMKVGTDPGCCIEMDGKTKIMTIHCDYLDVID